jgi:hypothetical protein
MDREREPVLLPYVVEPIALKVGLNAPENRARFPHIRVDVREATIRQGGAIAQLLYAAWKGQLRRIGVKWPTVVSASADHRDTWRGWLDDVRSWRDVQEAFVCRLSAQTSTPFGLAE